MISDRNHTSTILAIAAVGTLAGASVLPLSAQAQEASVPPASLRTAQAPTVDAKSALLTAIALGYPDIRSAGRVGDLYQVEAVGANGDTVRIYLDPSTGFVVGIARE